MHLAFACCSLLVAWKWGDWTHWRKYHSTLLYLVSMALLYEFFAQDYKLWQFHADPLTNMTWTILLYTFLTMPANVFVFLSRFPEGKDRGRQTLHYAFWIAIYMAGEILLVIGKRISYQNGWTLLMSFLFDCIMFPMLRLHFTRPLVAYVLSIPIIAAYLIAFHVPLP